MNRLLSCRRTFIATISLLLLTGLSLHNNIDVQTSIVTIVLGLCGANATENIMTGKRSPIPSTVPPEQ